MDASNTPTHHLVPVEALRWIVSDDTGMSSQALWAQMAGVPHECRRHHPHDPADLGRCLVLLARVPEWRARIGEMAAHGPAWSALVARWDELEACMADEVGIDWSKGQNAPKTYDLMDSIIDPTRPVRRRAER